jgi:hypothetical protein
MNQWRCAIDYDAVAMQDVGLIALGSVNHYVLRGLPVQPHTHSLFVASFFTLPGQRER